MKKLKQAVLAVALVICFAVATDKIYKAYQARTPVAEAGECLLLTTPDDGTFGVTIVENNSENKTSSIVVTVDIIPGDRTFIAIKDVPYSEIRQYSPRKVDCNEIR